MSIQEELAALIAAEEERLGVGSKEFNRRHQEIMEGIEQLMEQKGVEHIDKADVRSRGAGRDAGGI